MLSEQNSMFSGFVENTMEYYWNVLFLIVTFFASNLRAFVCVNNVSTNI
jgi:hypothetical protein